MVLSKELNGLYRDLLRAASRFHDPNFKAYFTRIIKDDFKSATTSDPEAFKGVQQKNLDVLQRQFRIQNMYYSEEFTTKR